ncbi:hypothetical protein AOQ84DRAFT_281824, partial [Glonium stellatum]
FCFFIDGLDEYEETPGEDYKDMIELLRSWTETASKDVKLCVSSREYSVFERYLSANQRLKLQDLTRADIEQLARDRLKGFNMSPEKNESGVDEDYLVQEVVTRADEVFLWVVLVLRSLREGLQHGDKLHDSLRRLSSIPRDLKDLFLHLLNSIHESYCRKAYRTFAMLRYRIQLDWNLSLFEYSLLDAYDDPEFAIKAPFRGTGTTEDDVTEQLERARNRVNGYYKGLLEVRGNEDSEDGTVALGTYVSFAHRSI